MRSQFTWTHLWDIKVPDQFIRCIILGSFFLVKAVIWELSTWQLSVSTVSMYWIKCSTNWIPEHWGDESILFHIGDQLTEKLGTFPCIVKGSWNSLQHIHQTTHRYGRGQSHPHLQLHLQSRKTDNGWPSERCQTTLTSAWGSQPIASTSSSINPHPDPPPASPQWIITLPLFHRN